MWTHSNSEELDIFHDGVAPSTPHPASCVPGLLIKSGSWLLRYSVAFKPLVYAEEWLRCYLCTPLLNKSKIVKNPEIRCESKMVYTLFYNVWKCYTRQTVAGIKIEVKGHVLYTLNQIAKIIALKATISISPSLHGRHETTGKRHIEIPESHWLISHICDCLCILGLCLRIWF